MSCSVPESNFANASGEAPTPYGIQFEYRITEYDDYFVGLPAAPDAPNVERES